MPSGVTSANMMSQKMALFLEMCDARSIVMRAIAMGMLCITMPVSRELWMMVLLFANGIPSRNEWMERPIIIA